MGYRKAPDTLIALLLILGVLTNSALSGACFCGEACLHYLQPDAKATSPIHMRCSGIPCKSCEMERGQTFKAASSVNQTFSAKFLDNELFLLFTLLNSPSTSHALVNFESSYPLRAIPSSPIYLQNLSILC